MRDDTEMGHTEGAADGDTVMVPVVLWIPLECERFCLKRSTNCPTLCEELLRDFHSSGNFSGLKSKQIIYKAHVKTAGPNQSVMQ